MTTLAVGKKVKVRHDDGRKYTFDVEVTKIFPPSEFIGRVEEVFANCPERNEVGLRGVIYSY